MSMGTTEQTTVDLAVSGEGCALYEARAIEAIKELWRRQNRDQEMRIIDMDPASVTIDLS